MTATSLLPDVGIELRAGYADVGDVNLHYVEAGSQPRAFESSRPTRVATTCRRSRRASSSTGSICSPPTSAASSVSSVRSPRRWSVTTGAARSPGRPR